MNVNGSVMLTCSTDTRQCHAGRLSRDHNRSRCIATYRWRPRWRRPSLTEWFRVGTCPRCRPCCSWRLLKVSQRMTPTCNYASTYMALSVNLSFSPFGPAPASPLKTNVTMRAATVRKIGTRYPSLCFDCMVRLDRSGCRSIDSCSFVLDRLFIKLSRSFSVSCRLLYMYSVHWCYSSHMPRHVLLACLVRLRHSTALQRWPSLLPACLRILCYRRSVLDLSCVCFVM